MSIPTSYGLMAQMRESFEYTTPFSFDSLLSLFLHDPKSAVYNVILPASWSKEEVNEFMQIFTGKNLKK